MTNVTFAKVHSLLGAQPNTFAFCNPFFAQKLAQKLAPNLAPNLASKHAIIQQSLRLFEYKRRECLFKGGLL